jgi:hypothetical protein
MPRTNEQPLYGTIAQSAGTYTVTYPNGQTTGYNKKVFEDLPEGAPIVDFSQVEFDKALRVALNTPDNHKQDLAGYLAYLKENGIPVITK